MKKLIFGVLFAGLLVACGGDTKKKIIDAPGSGGDDTGSGGGECNVLAQTGCASGEKCSWVHDSTTPPLGHIGCVANGTGAVGAACTYGADGATGFDNCQQGLVCLGGKCRTICDTNGGAPMCGQNFACARYEGLFANEGETAVAGVCDPTCNPLTDNDYLGSGTKTGTACAGSNTGCFGFSSDSPPTKFSCAGEFNKTLVHRSPCTTAAGCANAAGNPFINGCAQGYNPTLIDMTGSMQVVCIATCAPGNTYMGNPGTQAPAGVAPHRCNNNDARGNFNPATTANNGDHCMYSWLFELDADGNLVRSPFTDTLGYCLDHSKYKYDSNGDGMVNASDANWPLCSSLPDGFGSGSAVGAADFGCVDSMHAGLPFDGKAHVQMPKMELPRFPYHQLVRVTE
jgi:hypothetical protein